MCKAAESKIATADKALTSIHKALETFESVPGVHHLVNAVTESIDLGNAQKCLPVFIYGQYGVSKTEFLKAVVGRVFGNGVYQVNALKAIAHVEHLLVRNSVLLFDDFTWSVTANGTLMNVESVKGLLTQEDSSETRELLGRVGESARVRHDVIKMGSCNCASFEDWYGEKVAPQHLGAILRRINFINLHEFELPSGEVVDLCPVMTDDAKAHYTASGYRVVEVGGSLQRWPMYQIDIGVDHPNLHKSWAFPTDDTQPPPSPMPTRPPPTPVRLNVNPDEAVDSDGDFQALANGEWFAPDLGELISDGLVGVDASIPSDAPGVTKNIAQQSTSMIVEQLSSHVMFNTFAGAVALAFHGHWNFETRAGLFRDIEGKIPELCSGYFLTHMVRSLSYVFSLDEIPCCDEWYDMSSHTADAVNILTNGKFKPSDVVRYMRLDDDIGIVDSRIFPDDDMSLVLAICQTKSVWDLIQRGEAPMYDLLELAALDTLVEVYQIKLGETIGNGDFGDDHRGITSASTMGYRKLGGLLKPDSSVSVPFQFTASGRVAADKMKAEYFLRLMKALLKSRVIAKSPLKNASDIRGLYRAKVTLEAKGYTGVGLIGLLIATHRLWAFDRMEAFASHIATSATSSAFI